MGNSASSEKDQVEQGRNKRINREIAKDYKNAKDKVKLLLLGTGESGKSTLVKQMRALYGKKLADSPLDIKLQRHAVYSTVFSSMAALLQSSDSFVPLANESLADAKEEIIRRATSVHGSYKESQLMSPTMKGMLLDLWNDEGIRQTWENHRSDIQAQESLEYFMQNAERILSPDYQATEEDWVRARLRTTGVLSEEFVVDGVTFNIWDVGGQRNERKKWIHVFSNVTSVIYVNAINEYDESLFEDNNVNRMTESLNLFDEMVNHEQFEKSGMILFFNKSDLFKEKILRIPIKFVDPKNPMRSRWEDYDGKECTPGMDMGGPDFEQCYDDGIKFFTGKFLKLNQHPSTKDIYVHVTCAWDKSNVDAVFSACRDIILRQVLSDQGFARDFD